MNIHIFIWLFCINNKNINLNFEDKFKSLQNLTVYVKYKKKNSIKLYTYEISTMYEYLLYTK